jgi:3'(2'), 5'-bisphosphate nucleotidase
MIAEGLADEYPRFGPTMEWDTAAGHAIANASGKKLWLTDFSNELVYNKENLLNPYFIVK